MRGDFRCCRVSAVYPDKKGIVRNVEVLAAQKQDDSRTYNPQGLRPLRRHVSKLIVIKPVEENPSMEADHLRNLQEYLITNSSTIRNLDAAPSDGITQLLEETYLTTLGDRAEGACQVPVQDAVQLLQEDHSLENLGLKSKSKSIDVKLCF